MPTNRVQEQKDEGGNFQQDSKDRTFPFAVCFILAIKLNLQSVQIFTYFLAKAVKNLKRMFNITTNLLNQAKKYLVHNEQCCHLGA